MGSGNRVGWVEGGRSGRIERVDLEVGPYSRVGQVEVDEGSAYLSPSF